MSLTDVFLCVPFSDCCSTHLFRLVEGRSQGRSLHRWVDRGVLTDLSGRFVHRWMAHVGLSHGGHAIQPEVG